MTLTLELTPEQETKLRAQAAALELTPDAYLLHAAGLENGKAATPDTPPDGKAFMTPEEQEPYYNPAFAGKTLADVLAGRIGTQHSGRGDLSQNTGKAFTDILVEKREKGKL